MKFFSSSVLIATVLTSTAKCTLFPDGIQASQVARVIIEDMLIRELFYDYEDGDDFKDCFYCRDDKSASDISARDDDLATYHLARRSWKKIGEGLGRIVGQNADVIYDGLSGVSDAHQRGRIVPITAPSLDRPAIHASDFIPSSHGPPSLPVRPSGGPEDMHQTDNQHAGDSQSAILSSVFKNGNPFANTHHGGH